jgi:hypothetical protein
MKWNYFLVVLLSLISFQLCFAVSPVRKSLFSSPITKKFTEFTMTKGSKADVVAQNEKPVAAPGTSNLLKLAFGAGGIYAAFLYYGTLQEDVFHYRAADGSKFTQAWFLQALGSCCLICFSSALCFLSCRGVC